MKSKAVIDTNVLISGILWRGVPFRLLKWAEEGILTIYTSLDIMTEVYRVLHYSKLQQYIDKERVRPDELFEKIESLCTIVHVENIVRGVCPDEDDDKFLSCALSADVEYLVTGDSHLLDLGRYQTVRILTAAEFYEEYINFRELWGRT